MLKLGRYEIEHSPDRIFINVNQKKNALVNMAISLVISGCAIYQINATKDGSDFYYIFPGIGLLWFIAGFYAYKLKRNYSLSIRKLNTVLPTDQHQKLCWQVNCPTYNYIKSHGQPGKRKTKCLSPGESY